MIVQLDIRPELKNKESKYKSVIFVALVLKLEEAIYCTWTTEGNDL